MANVLDLRLQGSFNILVTRGVIYDSIKLDFKNGTPPADLVISIPQWNTNVSRNFSVGNGLTISGSAIIWDLGLVDTPKSTVTGTIKTTNTVFGSAISLTFNLSIS